MTVPTVPPKCQPARSPEIPLCPPIILAAVLGSVPLFLLIGEQLNMEYNRSPINTTVHRVSLGHRPLSLYTCGRLQRCYARRTQMRLKPQH